MWSYDGNDIRMAEGDYGIALPVTVNGVTLSERDNLKFVFKKTRNGETVLEKEYVPVNNTVGLELTEAESGLFHVGDYVYCLDWYQDGSFLCNIIPIARFRVVDKA